MIRVSICEWDKGKTGWRFQQVATRVVNGVEPFFAFPSVMLPGFVIYQVVVRPGEVIIHCGYDPIGPSHSEIGR